MRGSELGEHVEAALELGGVGHHDHNVRIAGLEVVTRHLLLGRVGGKAVGSGEVDHTALRIANPERPLFPLDSLARPVAHMLPRARKAVEQGRLPGIWLAKKSDRNTGALPSRRSCPLGRRASGRARLAAHKATSTSISSQSPLSIATALSRTYTSTGRFRTFWRTSIRHPSVSPTAATRPKRAQPTPLSYRAVSLINSFPGRASCPQPGESLRLKRKSPQLHAMQSAPYLSEVSYN